MRMRANARLAYGVIVDEEKIYDIIGEVYEDGFYEYMEDNYPSLDITSCGADMCELYVVGPMNNSKSVEWGEWLKITRKDLKDPWHTVELAKFCEDHKIDDYYGWYLGAYFG